MFVILTNYLKRIDYYFKLLGSNVWISVAPNFTCFTKEFKILFKIATLTLDQMFG